MLISEIFLSLQGEGPWTGLPALFIRFSGCVEPLCPWCDTAYALHEGREMSEAQVLREVESRPCTRVVITGGEPFLQWDSGLSGLHRTLMAQGLKIQYETSGKIRLPRLSNALVVCSPKHIGGTWRFEEANLDIVHVFKFVAGGTEWFAAIDEFISRYRIDPERVYIMPLGATRDEQIRNMETVWVYCLKRGYRMSPRLHILIHDTGRGV